MLPVTIRQAEAIILVLLAALAAVLSVAYCYALSAGHDWGDDYGLYLQIADNIAAGRPLTALTTNGEIVPTGFPYLLAAWANLGGWDFRFLKLLNVLAWIGSAAATYGLARCTVRPLPAAACSFAVFALPGMVFGINTILTDIPFVFASTAALWMACEYDRHAQLSPIVVRAACLTALGIAMLLAMWLRTAGLALPAALAAHYASRNLRALWDERRFDKAALHGGVVVAIALACTVVMSASSIRIYLAHTGGAPVAYRERMTTEFMNLVTVFCGFDPLSRAIGPWGLAATMALAFTMLWQRRGATPLHWFVLAYACMLINTPWTGGMRYLYPLAPALLVLAVGGVAACESHAASLPWARRHPAITSLLSAGALGALSIAPIAMHGARYNFQTAVSMGRAATGLITAPDDARSAEALALADWLRLNTPPEAILCAFKPRAVGYFAQRRTLHIAEPYAGTGATYLANKGAHCFVMAYHPNVGYAEIAAHLLKDPSLEAAFDNGVYRVFTPVPGNEPGHQAPSDGNP